jgi:diguanylate cyclase (GGDEF)-like protein
VNDAHGHEVGDAILSSSAKLIQSQLGERDILGRWGGEEFIVIQFAQPPDSALQLAERVRAIVHASVHPVAGSVTVSAGVAAWSAEESFDAVLRRADRALYRAKARGRNCTEIARPEPDSEAVAAETVEAVLDPQPSSPAAPS